MPPAHAIVSSRGAQLSWLGMIYKALSSPNASQSIPAAPINRDDALSEQHFPHSFFPRIVIDGLVNRKHYFKPANNDFEMLAVST